MAGYRQKLMLGGVVATAAVAAYLFIGIGSDWNYILMRRLLKVATVALTSIAIGCSTVLFQTITNNRILTPSLIGIDSLYMLLQTVVVFTFGATSSAWTNATAHFVLSAGLLIVFSGLIYKGLFRRHTFNMYFILLVGLICGILFQSLSSFLQMLVDPNEFVVVQGRMFASFNSARPDLLVLACVAMIFIALSFRPIAKYMDVLSLGREHAINLGVHYHQVVQRLWLIVTALVSIATALVGPITFLGLLVANVAYEYFRTYRHSVLLVGAALLSLITLIGALLVVERVLAFSTTVSVIINFAGSLYFLYLVLRESQS